MRYLLDTNALINEMFNPIKLSDEAKNAIEIGNEVYISVAALWEIGIKQSIKKLDISATIEEIADECKRQDIQIIPILPSHIDKMKTLPHHHGDPFDRIIIAQAIEGKMILITSDGKIEKYDLDILKY